MHCKILENQRNVHGDFENYPLGKTHEHSRTPPQTGKKKKKKRKRSHRFYCGACNADKKMKGMQNFVLTLEKPSGMACFLDPGYQALNARQPPDDEWAVKSVS
ncbi:hypothetical protein AAC387_Pa01g1774 [Persea americana]